MTYMYSCATLHEFISFCTVLVGWLTTASSGPASGLGQAPFPRRSGTLCLPTWRGWWARRGRWRWQIADMVMTSHRKTHRKTIGKCWLNGISWQIPSGYIKNRENGHRKFVSFPIETWWFSILILPDGREMFPNNTLALDHFGSLDFLGFFEMKPACGGQSQPVGWWLAVRNLKGRIVSENLWCGASKVCKRVHCVWFFSFDDCYSYCLLLPTFLILHVCVLKLETIN